MATARVGSSEDPDWTVVAGSLGATIAALTGLMVLLWMGRTAVALDAGDMPPFVPGQLLALGTNADAAPGGDSTDVTDEPSDAAPTAPAADADPTPADPADAEATPTEPTQDGAPDTISTDAARPRSRDDAGARPPASSGARDSRDPSRLASKLPGVDLPGTSGGQPTGSPQGFSDRLSDGDPWATDVLKALSKARVGTFGGDLPSGTLRFKLTICPDGRIDRVKRIAAGSTIAADGADRVVLGISRVDLGRPPAEVRAAMGGRCRPLDYTFAWTATGVG